MPCKCSFIESWRLRPKSQPCHSHHLGLPPRITTWSLLAKFLNRQWFLLNSCSLYVASARTFLPVSHFFPCLLDVEYTARYTIIYTSRRLSCSPLPAWFMCLCFNTWFIEEGHWQDCTSPVALAFARAGSSSGGSVVCAEARSGFFFLSWNFAHLIMSSLEKWNAAVAWRNHGHFPAVKELWSQYISFLPWLQLGRQLTV